MDMCDIRLIHVIRQAASEERVAPSSQQGEGLCFHYEISWYLPCLNICSGQFGEC